MKVCYFSNLYPPYVIGGAEKYVYQLACSISKHADVVVVTTSPYIHASVSYQNGVKVHRIYPTNLCSIHNLAEKPFYTRALWYMIDTWNPHSYFLVKRILSRERPDIVHTHIATGLSPSIFSAIKAMGYPHVHTLHGYSLITPNMMKMRSNLVHKTYTKFMRLMARSIDVVVSPSKFMMHQHQKLGFFDNTKKLIIPHGVESINQYPHKDYEVLHILYVGQLSKHKGLHILIRAFRKLSQTNVRLHIVGHGSLAGEVSQLASRDSRVTFHSYVTEEQLRDLYSKASLVVVPSIWFEPFGLVIIESFSFGTPVLASAVGAIPELVKDGYNGILSKPGDVENLRLAMETVLSDTQLMKELSKNAWESSKEYDMNKHVTRLLYAYEDARKHDCPEISEVG